MKKSINVLCVFILAFLISSCDDLIKNPVKEFATTIEEVIFNLDNTINGFRSDSREAFAQLADLDHTISKFFGTANYSADYIIQRIGAEFTVVTYCSVDYLDDRVEELLRQLRAELKGEPYKDVRKARLCNMSHVVLDMNAHFSARNYISIVGYNLDIELDQVMVYFKNSKKSLVLPRRCINTISDHEIVVKFDYSDETIDEFDNLVFEIDGNEFVTLSIIHKRPPEPRIKTINFTPPAFTLVADELVRGDGDLHGAPLNSYQIRFGFNSKHIWVQMAMSSKELKPDWTYLKGLSEKHIIYTAEENFSIVGIREWTALNRGFWKYIIRDYLDTDHAPNIFYSNIGATTLRSDDKGQDYRHATIEQHFNNLHVLLKENL